jgi:tetratricopeptide (TPR) repeat protein
MSGLKRRRSSNEGAASNRVIAGKPERDDAFWRACNDIKHDVDMGNGTVADERSRYLIQNWPDDALAWLYREYALVLAPERYQEAYEAARRAYAIAPDDKHVLLTLWHYEKEAGRYEEAKRLLSRARKRQG